MRCYLIRHAQTVWNRDNRFQGRTDSALSPLGVRQAECLGAHFAGRPVGAIYSSALARTVRTAQAIAGRVGVAAAVEPGLAEMDLGQWEGLTPQEIDARFSGAFQAWRVKPSSVTIPDGEPPRAFHERVRGAFTRVASRHRERELVVVTHGGAIASLLADWLHADYDRMLSQLVINNAGVSAVEWQPSSPAVLWVNSIAHLDPTLIATD